jgi:hypothetical protein
MRKIRLTAVVLLSGALFDGAVFFCSARQGLSQTATVEPTAPVTPPAARPQFFAGTVVELDGSHIKVTRTLVGRPTESRSFAINPATKMNKAATKLHNRVTVRYRHVNEGDVALEIQPRPVITRTPKS